MENQRDGVKLLSYMEKRQTFTSIDYACFDMRHQRRMNILSLLSTPSCICTSAEYQESREGGGLGPSLCKNNDIYGNGSRSSRFHDPEAAERKVIEENQLREYFPFNGSSQNQSAVR